MNKNKLNRLDEMMQSQVDSGMIPGGHLRIIKDGERVYDKCFGMADVARNLKVSDNTIYRLYSMTKPITAVATMILYDRGLIDLSDNVSWFLEGFKDQKVETKDGIVPANRDVKIIDLLTMTAGLMYPDRNVNPSGDKMADLFDKFYERAFPATAHIQPLRCATKWVKYRCSHSPAPAGTTASAPMFSVR